MPRIGQACSIITLAGIMATAKLVEAISPDPIAVMEGLDADDSRCSPRQHDAYPDWQGSAIVTTKEKNQRKQDGPEERDCKPS